jgi:3',5'-cyclic AMP phosphodiesterase CpdA
MSRADGEFDALLIAGDIAEIGDKGAYRMIWRDIDDSIFASKPVFLATGNHDIRFNYKGNTKYIVNKAEELESTRADVIAGIGGAYVRKLYLMQKYNLDEKEAAKWAAADDPDAGQETED